MSYTLLQLVDQVSGELGLTQPAAVIGSSNNQTIQLLALAQRLGKGLRDGLCRTDHNRFHRKQY